MTTRSWKAIDKSGLIIDNPLSCPKPMPYRKTPFITGQFYHIYNRGSEKRVVYEDKRDYHRFLRTAQYYQLKGPKPKLSHFFKYQQFKPHLAKNNVEIIAFCLMPNHFHLLVRQLEDGGITEMITKLSLSYTKYFNTRYNRVGPLFQGQFKAVLIETDEQLIHVSRYIHLNPIASFLVKDLSRYEYSSYNTYFNDYLVKSCNPQPVLELFASPSDYQKFVNEQIDLAQSMEIIKHQIIDDFLA